MHVSWSVLKCKASVIQFIIIFFVNKSNNGTEIMGLTMWVCDDALRRRSFGLEIYSYK